MAVMFAAFFFMYFSFCFYRKGYVCCSQNRQSVSGI